MRLQQQLHRRATAMGGAKRSKARVVLPQAVAAAQSTVESQAFNDLVQYSKLQTSLQLGTLGDKGNGLCATQSLKAGQVLMRVPRGLALVLDYEQGLQLPEGRWPRLREGVNHPEALPWDVLFALALVDGLAGDGDAFWGAWCQAVLPPPESLTLPLCWDKDRLATLQHDEVAQAALKQQERLRTLFPHLSEVVEGQTCSWLEWAFACVRSRAFRLSEDLHAFIPFMDLANHSQNPNADFRLAGDAFELVAVRDVAAGDEVTIRYGDEKGYTNQRWQATYGFVPEGGNTADRVTLDTAGQAGEGRGLQLSRLQDRLGDSLFLQAISGRNARMHAALRSLPWAAEDLSHLDTQFDQVIHQGLPLEATLATAQPGSVPGGGATGSEGAGAAAGTPAQGPGEASEQAATAAGAGGAAQASFLGLPQEDRTLAQRLRDACEEQLQACPSTLDEDVDALSVLQALPQAQRGVRELSALRYRVERKQLLKSVKLLLDIYLRE